MEAGGENQYFQLLETNCYLNSKRNVMQYFGRKAWTEDTTRSI
jgi:hypothetical protein